ncbi:FadR/GntR family transcriptional regulator [Fodinicurvata sp. EGI_FJ10296]|uniref:FadR/GntR family transcriptional regulator n=1 Tax=Fodinicurvata sp. EGI_FJ10296 TaxID=3231908 RepID=UPI0034550E41
MDDDARGYPDRGLHGRVVRAIGERIVAGRIDPAGSFPRESELAEEFAVSRTAIREAIKVLAAKGLVVSRQKVGTRVRPRDEWNLLDPDVLAWHAANNIDERMITDLTALRDTIEPATARMAAESATAVKRQQIAVAVAAMEANLDDKDAYYRADLSFHEAIFAACGNPFFECLGPVVRALLAASFRVQQKSVIHPSDGFALHKAVFDAIDRRDPDGAEAAMRAIVRRARDELHTILSVADSSGADQ